MTGWSRRAASFGLRHAGLKALSSLRMEKGYRDYGHDIDNTDTVLEAGLGFAVALDKPGGFIGRDAVAAQKAAGPLTRRLVQVLLTDPEPLLFHAEVVRRNGAEVGYIRAASYGWTLGGAVGLAMIDSGGAPIDQAWLDAASGRCRSATGSSRPERRSGRSTTRQASGSGCNGLALAHQMHVRARDHAVGHGVGALEDLDSAVGLHGVQRGGDDVALDADDLDDVMPCRRIQP